MGNRAFVIFTAKGEHSPAVYLHWNGGPESIYTMLDALVEFGQRPYDESYTCARFIQLVGNYFGGTLSLGVQNAGSPETWPAAFDCGDNGLYVIEWTGTREYGVERFIGGSRMTEAFCKRERAKAKKHSYNKDGALLSDIRAVNKAFTEKAVYDKISST